MGDKTASSPVVMATSGVSAAVTEGTPKKAANPKNPRVKPTHPKTAEMVNSAIKALKERGGSSVQVIKKYMVGTYKVDVEKQAIFIKKYLKAAVASGILIQTKGKGAAGSFKLASAKLETTKPKPKPAPKTAALIKKAAGAKKPVAVKKPANTVIAKKASTKKTATTAVSEKKNKVSKGPAAKPPKAKTTKTKPAAKSPAMAKPAALKKTISAAAKPKKAVTKKATVSKKLILSTLHPSKPRSALFRATQTL